MAQDLESPDRSNRFFRGSEDVRCIAFGAWAGARCFFNTTINSKKISLITLYAQTAPSGPSWAWAFICTLKVQFFCNYWRNMVFQNSTRSCSWAWHVINANVLKIKSLLVPGNEMLIQYIIIYYFKYCSYPRSFLCISYSNVWTSNYRTHKVHVVT